MPPVLGYLKGWRCSMGEHLIGGLLKQLRQHYPYTPPGDVYPNGAAHEFMWNLALREGREQVIRWIAENAGLDVPTYDPDSRDVFSTEDRSSPAADASARSRPGS
jgi:hypothetical protein